MLFQLSREVLQLSSVEDEAVSGCVMDEPWLGRFSHELCPFTIAERLQILCMRGHLRFVRSIVTIILDLRPICIGRLPQT